MTKIDIAALVAGLTTKSAMINMGEKIAWGSETALMDQAVAALIAQDAEIARLRLALEFYADARGDGYDAYIAGYGDDTGPAVEVGRIIEDGGQIARAALAANPQEREG